MLSVSEVVTFSVLKWLSVYGKRTQGYLGLHVQLDINVSFSFFFSFYVILKGSVSVYARKEDEHHSEYYPHHDMNVVRSTQERLAYFGTDLGGLKIGRSFGEMVLMSDKKERNATVIADELTELIIIHEELFKKSFNVYNLEWKKKSRFALACPLFNSWPTALKALLIENLKMHTIQFGNRVVEQGCQCNSVYFIGKGAGKVLSDPRKCKEQYETLNPKRREKKFGDEEEKIELNAIEDLVRPLTIIEKRRRRLEHGFVAMETRLRQREIQATTIGPNDVIGDVEMILDIPEYCTSVECVETLEVYELDKGSFQRLIARRSTETLGLLRKVVVAKLRLRAERFSEIPLFKYLLERATAFPKKATTKAIRKNRYQQEAVMRPLIRKGQRDWKAVKPSAFEGRQTLNKAKGEIKNKLEKKAQTTHKEKEQNSRRGNKITIRPEARKVYGSNAHEEKPNGLLTHALECDGSNCFNTLY